MRRLPALAALLALATSLAACGERTEPLGPQGTRTLNVELDFFPNADHAGLYSAIANGDFRRVGLDVHPRVPSDPSAPLKLLAAGQVDVAISYEPELLLARDRGERLVSIGALVQQPLTSIIALGDRHLQGVNQLGGRTVGTAGIPYQSAELQTALANARVDPHRVREVNVGFDLVPAMLSHKVDATLGGFWNYEGIQLAQAHKRPTIVRVDQAGVPTYDELVLVVREDEARRRGAELRAFLQALTRGERAVRRDPAQAADQLVAANHDLDKRLQLASIRATLPVVFPVGGRPFGFQEPRSWDAFGRWMYDHRLLTRPPYAAHALTNEFLPGLGI